MGYPDTENFAYNFNRAELNLDGTIYVAISNVTFDQATTSAGVYGTRPFPLYVTEGNVAVGAGTITFSEEEDRIRFIESLGNNFRQKRWTLTWILSSPNRPNITLTCKGCRVLSTPFAHAQGDDALGGDITFDALTHTVNGLAPHEGMPTS